jgi:hypothetical protein
MSLDVEAFRAIPTRQPFQWITWLPGPRRAYDAAKEFVARIRGESLASLIDYQRNMVILPSYDPRVGKAFATDFNWPLYFRRAKGHRAGTALEDISRALNSVVDVTITCTDGMALIL